MIKSIVAAIIALVAVTFGTLHHQHSEATSLSTHSQSAAAAVTQGSPNNSNVTTTQFHHLSDSLANQPMQQIAGPSPISAQSPVYPLPSSGSTFVRRDELTGVFNQFARVVSLLPQAVSANSGFVSNDFFIRQTERTQDSVGDAVHNINDSLNGYLPLEGGTISGDLSINTVAITGSATTTAQNGFNIAQGCFAINGSCVGLGSFSGLLSVSSGGTGWTNINSGSILFGNGSGALATSSSLFWDNGNGRLGIGTTPPADKLDVNGAIGLTATGSPLPMNGIYLFPNNSGLANALPTLGLTARDGTPTFQILESAEAGQFDDTTGIGYGALANWIPSASVGPETAIGYDALHNVTTGDHNTALGAFAMYTTQTGSHSTGLGIDSLRYVPAVYTTVAVGEHSFTYPVSVSMDTAIGYNAGFNLGTSTSDTAIGYNALQGLMANRSAGTIYDDVAVGANALASISDGAHNNNAIGYSALTNLTTGIYDQAIGSNAGLNLTTASNDILIGASAGSILTTGSANVLVGANGNSTGTGDATCVGVNAVCGNFDVAVGYKALGSISAINGKNAVLGFQAFHLDTSGSNNTGVGYGVGSAITTGSNNTELGYSVGSTMLSTGSGNILIGSGANNVDVPASNTSNFLNIGNLIYGINLGASTGAASTTPAGNLAIGTTTPSARLTVWGPDTASSTSAFAVVNSASTTEFSVFDGGNAQLAGTLTQSSDRRLKTHITGLDASSSLSAIQALNPVSYNWTNGIFGNGGQLGFIAQDVQKVFPQLVSTTSPTELTPGGTLGLNYNGLIAPIVAAIKEIAGISGAFKETLVAWLGDANNSIHDLYACIIHSQEEHTQLLCVGTTCVTPQQFQLIVAAAGQGSAPPQPSTSDLPSDTSPVDDATSSAASIEQAGTTVTDGASTDPTADIPELSSEVPAAADTQSTADTSSAPAIATN